MTESAAPEAPEPPRRFDRLLFLLFLLVIGVRLLSVYPPPLRHDPATIALQACRILDGERPLFWSGQAWMGAAGTYVEALLFALFGKNTLVMSLYAWTLSSVWILLSLLVALRFFGRRVAIVTAVLWLVPTHALMYWSSQARNDFQVFFIATPALLLLTHDVVTRFRAGKDVAGRVLFLGFFGGFSFWQNMGIGPCLVVTFAVLILHLGRRFWTRYLWCYAPAWLLGFSPVLYYNLSTDFALVRQGTFKGFGTIAKAVSDLITNVLPIFWGMPLRGQPWTVGKAAQIFFLAWTALLFALYVGAVYRKWRRREDLLADQLVLGLAVFHVLVPTVTQYGRSFATAGNPILYITNLYTVAFVIPAVVLARRRGWAPLLLALPFLIYFGNNVRNTRSYPEKFLAALREQGTSAITRFPNPDHPFIKFLVEKKLAHGYLESAEGPFLNLAGLHLVEFSRPFADRVVEYSLRTDAAEEIFWAAQYGLPEGFSMIGARFEKARTKGHLIYHRFEKDLAPESLIERVAVKTSHDAPGVPFLTDRRIDTAWTVPAPLPESWIEFEFPAAEPVARVTLLPWETKTLPPHLIVQRSSDGTSWETVQEWKQANTIFWSVRHPFLKLVKPRCEVALSLPEPVRHLRILFPTQRGTCALREVYLYRQEPAAGPAPSLDGEIDALARALGPLKKTHQIAGDHYFMSFFELAGFDVEFLPNRAVNNSGRINPFLASPLPVDFSRPLALIVPKSHGASTAGQLGRHGIPFARTAFAYHDLYVTSPATSTASLYWSGFDLLETGGAPAARR